MFEAKINIYKVIKMLAKIKYDEDFFKRPLDTNSQWYKLSRSKIDYRQISFDRINRERPGLSDQLNKKVPIFEMAGQLNDNPLFKKSFGLPPSSKYSTGYHRVANYEKLPPNYYYDHQRAVDDFGEDRFWEDDIIYSLKYDAYNFWWFDTCLIPEQLQLLIGAASGLRLGYYGGTLTDDDFAEKYNYKYSPSRDLATSTFLHFASMQENPQAFIHKTSYITAPYMPYVEQQKIFMSPASKTTFNSGNPTDYTGIVATIYGIGELVEVFSDTSKSSLDRINRQKMFNDFFQALDNANWLVADKLADQLINLTDGTGWAPYIGYGDFSLFIQRMNIPSEYIMTHALTNFQDEILTNAFAATQINNRVMDAAYKIQTGNSLDIYDELVSTPLGQVKNTAMNLLYDETVTMVLRTRRAISNHIMVGGTVESAQEILKSAPSNQDAIEILESKMIEIAIDEEIKNANLSEKV
jgi:hypothetical protein